MDEKLKSSMTDKVTFDAIPKMAMKIDQSTFVNMVEYTSNNQESGFHRPWNRGFFRPSGVHVEANDKGNGTKESWQFWRQRKTTDDLFLHSSEQSATRPLDPHSQLE